MKFVTWPIAPASWKRVYFRTLPSFRPSDRRQPILAVIGVVDLFENKQGLALRARTRGGGAPQELKAESQKLIANELIAKSCFLSS
jgi:hypothetical protein